MKKVKRTLHHLSVDKRSTMNHLPILTILSRIFDPFIVIAIATIAVVLNSTLTFHDQLEFLFLLFAVMIIPPALLLAIAVKTKRIKNWDISDRSQRPEALIILFLLGFLNIMIVQWFGDRSLVHLFITYQLWLAGFMATTFFWKIYGHASVMALATGILVKTLGWYMWPVLFFVPIISIVRVLRHDHTPMQVLIGSLYSWAIVIFS